MYYIRWILSRRRVIINYLQHFEYKPLSFLRSEKLIEVSGFLERFLFPSVPNIENIKKHEKQY